MSEEEPRFEMLVDDAAAWVEKLAADERFTGVTIAGHSEGSRIGMLAAKQARRSPSWRSLGWAGPRTRPCASNCPRICSASKRV